MSRIIATACLALTVSGCATLDAADRYCFDIETTALSVGDSIARDTAFDCFMVRATDSHPVSVVDRGGGRRGLTGTRLHFWKYTNAPECSLTQIAHVAVTYTALRPGDATVRITTSNGSTTRTETLTLNPSRGTRTLISRGPPILAPRPSSVILQASADAVAVSKVCFIRSRWA